MRSPRLALMTPREQAAYDAGLRAAIHAARTVAITMETAPDATDVRKQAATAALYAFAEGAGSLALTDRPSPGFTVMETIAGLPGDAGEIPCPECSGRFQWLRDSSNGHVHGQCEAGCLTVMQ